MPYIFQPDRELLKEQVKQNKGFITGKVLDVGAGRYDRYSKFFEYEEYTRMDVVAGENIDVIARAENMPFSENSFDSIVCTQVFEHLKNPEKAAEELSRVLKKGGYCVLTVPQTNELHSEPHDYFRYTKYGLKELFSRYDLAVVKIKQRGGFFTLKAQMNIRYLIDKFNLYQNSMARRVVGKLLFFYGKYMMWLDSLDKSKENKKHTLGWVCVLKK